jgi:predicted methyltransferase
VAGVTRRPIALALLVACAYPPADPAASPSADAAAPSAPPTDHGHAAPTAAHRFGDAERWAKVFDDPARDAWQKPAELVAALGIAPGSAVADVGAGTGYLAPHLARAVGPDGRVILMDIEISLVAHMADRIAREGLTGVEARLSPSSGPALQVAEIDLAILLDVAHHIEDRPAWFTALRAGLKPGGRVAIVDFKDGELPVGPPPDHRLPAERLTAELTGAGWALAASPDVLPYQYIRVFTVAE